MAVGFDIFTVGVVFDIWRRCAVRVSRLWVGEMVLGAILVYYLRLALMCKSFEWNLWLNLVTNLMHMKESQRGWEPEWYFRKGGMAIFTKTPVTNHQNIEFKRDTLKAAYLSLQLPVFTEIFICISFYQFWLASRLKPLLSNHKW